MQELIEIVETIEPHEILLVADAMTGQEAVRVAKAFDDSLELDGLILTKLDGDSRGGSALSMRAITGKPIKFIGVGEKADALEPFHPERMAGRILGMGDVLSLIEKASKQVSEEDAKKLEKKFRKNEFTFEDFYQQLQTMKKMGSVSSLMGMIPGMGAMSQQIDENKVEQDMKRTEAIILSMTKAERNDHEILNGSRRKRIAKGSGTSVEEVNKLVTQFTQMKTMMKKMSKMSPDTLKGLMGSMCKFAGGFPGGLKR
jgi:signal recognition particle subunit SRP54